MIGSKEIPCIAAPNQIRCCINPLVCCPLPLSGAGNDSLQRRKGREDAPTKRATGLLHSNSRSGRGNAARFIFFYFFLKKKKKYFSLESCWDLFAEEEEGRRLVKGVSVRVCSVRSSEAALLSTGAAGS